MPTRSRTAPLSIAAALVVLLVATAASAGARMRIVGTDPSGDWGGGAASEGGAVAGEDLLAAFIGEPDAETIDFTLELVRTAPEQAHVAFAVYEWYFSVDGRSFGFYGPCQGHVYGECETATDPMAFVVVGPEGEHMGVARVNADASQVTFPIPREFLGAARGSVIAPLPATNHDDQAAVVAHTTYFVNLPTDDPTGGPDNASPRDVLVVKKAYRVRL